MEFKIGDTVVHKGSGKQMVVIAVIKDYFVTCRYLNEVTGRYEVQEFFPQEFTLVNPEGEKER
jgi:uncharacterized protein YodC (DUF2158 family)